MEECFLETNKRNWKYLNEYDGKEYFNFYGNERMTSYQQHR